MNWARFVACCAWIFFILVFGLVLYVLRCLFLTNLCDILFKYRGFLCFLWLFVSSSRHCSVHFSMHVSFFDSWALSGGNLIRVLLGFFVVCNVYLVDFCVCMSESRIFLFLSLFFFFYIFCNLLRVCTIWCF